MKYTTTGSSNTATNGQNIDLSIRIQKEKDGKSPFTIKKGKKIQIHNLDKIVSSENLSKIKCSLVLKNGSNVEFPFNETTPSSRYIKKRNSFGPFSFFEIKITGCKALLNDPSVTLNISFYDKDTSKEVTVDFLVYKKLEPLEITSFTASPSVIQTRSSVQFDWQIKAGSTAVTTIRKDNNEKPEITNGSKIIPAVGDHNYTLVLTEGERSVAKTIKIRVLERSDFYNSANPGKFTIGNFCIGQHSHIMYSLMLDCSNSISIDHIGYSIDPSLGNWSKFTLTDEDKEKLKPFITSPMMHLKSNSEVYGRLFFVGGSYLGKNEDFDDSANKVAIVDLENDLKVEIIDLACGKRWAHSCAIYPNTSNQDAIWLLGGIDEFGNSHNDIWTSENGKEWKKLQETVPWSARCMTGITVQLDKSNHKKALWFGGGFDGIDGKSKSDIWKYEGNQWKKIGLTTNKNSISFGLSFVGKDNINATGIYTIGSYFNSDHGSKNVFQRISLKNGIYSYNDLGEKARVKGLSTVDNAYIITAFFKGCMWYLVIIDKGDSGTTFSNIYYWTPEVTQRTILYQ